MELTKRADQLLPDHTTDHGPVVPAPQCSQTPVQVESNGDGRGGSHPEQQADREATRTVDQRALGYPGCGRRFQPWCQHCHYRSCSSRRSFELGCDTRSFQLCSCSGVEAALVRKWMAQKWGRSGVIDQPTAGRLTSLTRSHTNTPATPSPAPDLCLLAEIDVDIQP